MTVLVTGGAGYIGSHMVLELLEAGEKVVVLDNLSTGFAWAVPEGVPLVVGDFGDEALVAALLREHDVSEIIHFAAKIVVPESVADPLGYYLNNTAMARSLIALRGRARREALHLFIHGRRVRRSRPLAGERGRAAPSHVALRALEADGRMDARGRVARPSHEPCGAALFQRRGRGPQGARRAIDSQRHPSHQGGRADRRWAFRPGMEVFGTDYPTPDGSGVRDFIQVTDLARAHLDALRYLRAGGASQTCNVGYQRGYSVLEVIKLVKEISGVDFPVKLSARRPGDVGAIVAGNARIRSELGWTPKHDDLRAILQQALDWERRLHNRQG